MATLVWPPKDPGEVEDFDINWAPRLVSDVILTSTWAITLPTTAPEPLLVINSNSFIPQRTKVWLSAGTLGQTYWLQNTVTTAGGDTLIETAALVIKLK